MVQLVVYCQVMYAAWQFDTIPAGCKCMLNILIQCKYDMLRMHAGRELSKNKWPI